MAAPDPDLRVYLAQGLDHQRIQLIWLELPAHLEADTVPIRLFMAGTDPPQPILPIDVQLPCRLESASQYAALGPITIPFDLEEDGSLSGRYTWYSCPECVECYMRWQYTMEMTVAARDREVIFSIESVHFGHNVQGDYLSAVIPLARNAGVQPQIECNRLNECKEVHFVPKTSP